MLLDPSVLRVLASSSHNSSGSGGGGGSLQSPLPVCALPSSSDAKLTAASAKSSTPLGDAAISWRCDGLTSGLSLNASVPVGATAELFLPTAFGGTVTEGGGGGGGTARPVFSDGKFVAGGADGVVAGRSVVDAQAVVLELLSGSYVFTVAH